MTRPALALLGSGEFEPWTEPVDRWLLDTARRAGRSDRVLIFPAASAAEGDDVFDRWGNMGLEHYRSLGIPAEVVPVKTRRDADRADLAARLDGAAVVFFSGGNPAFLADVLAGSRLWASVLRELEEGLAYAGCSAGIVCLGEVAPDSAAAARDGAMALTRPGLRLFPKTYFGAHWDMLDTFIPGLRDMIVSSVPADCRLLGLDERTALVGDGTAWRVVGAGGAHLYEGGAWRSHPAGQTFDHSLLAAPATTASTSSP